ncbi:MAG: trypsin-like serine protease [Devosia sp.]
MGTGVSIAIGVFGLAVGLWLSSGAAQGQSVDTSELESSGGIAREVFEGMSEEDRSASGFAARFFERLRARESGAASASRYRNDVFDDVDVQASVKFHLSDPTFNSRLREGLAGPENGRERVYHGKTTALFPNVAWVERDGVFRCSAVLIGSSRTLLTAAHCLCQQPPTEAFFAIGTSDALADRRAIASTLVVALPMQKGEAVSEFCVRWSAMEQRQRAASGDIAILTLKQDAPWYARPSQITRKLADSFDSFVVGYGLTNQREVSRNVRQVASQVVVSLDCMGTVEPTEALCEGERGDLAANTYSKEAFYGCVPGVELVARGEPSPRPPDACRGDSGGPLFAGPIPTKPDARPLVIGLVSRSVAVKTCRTVDATECGLGHNYVSFANQRARTWVYPCIESLTAAQPRPDDCRQ